MFNRIAFAGVGPERLSNSLVALAMENDVPPDKAIRGRAIRFGEQQHGV
jgi:hypothetical protein